MKNWLTEIVFPYEYCEYLNEKHDALVLKSRQYKILSALSSSKKPSHHRSLFSSFKYSFFSPLLFVETVTLSVRKKSLLEFVIRRYIKKLNLFESGFHYCYDILSFNGESAVVNLYVLSHEESDEILKNTPYTSKPVSCLLPLEYVIVEILSRIGGELVVSIWTDHEQVLILTTQGKKIISRSVYKHKCKFSEISQWPMKNDFLRNAIDFAKRQFSGQDVSLLVWGDVYKDLKNTLNRSLNLSVDEKLEKKINQKIKLPNEVCQYAVLLNPALFGLPICQTSQTFISSSYHLTYFKFMYSRYALMISVFVFMVFLWVNAQSFVAQKKMEDILFQNTASIDSGVRQINTRIPRGKIFDDVLNKAKLKIAFDSELNVSNFLGWMTNITPEKTVINQLSIDIVLKDKKNDRGFPIKKQYAVAIKLAINRDYVDSITQIDRFFERLNERVKSPEANFIYLNENDKVPSALSVNFIVEPDRFY